jgi:phosphohistidine phosphatase SixA
MAGCLQASASEMAELEVLTQSLRRQRRDLDELMDSTLVRSGQTAELVSRIEDLQRRIEDTQRRFEAGKTESARNPDK